MSKFTKDYRITMKDIVREGAPLLRKVTDEVPLPPSDEDRETLMCMLQFIKNSQNKTLARKYKLRPSWGLSANQINLNKKMFAIYLVDDSGKEHEYTLLNPKIISHSLSMHYLAQGEGCLSVDRPVVGYVPRYEKVTVKAFNLLGEELILKFKGLLSIIVQHEMDHLNGIMFYDHINPEHPFKLPDNVTITSVT